MGAEEFRKEVALHSTPLEELVEPLLSRMEQLERDFKRLDAENKRLSEAGRRRRVSELEGRLCGLCNPLNRAPGPDAPQHRRAYYYLVNEFLRPARRLPHLEHFFALHATNFASVARSAQREMALPRQDENAPLEWTATSGATPRSEGRVDNAPTR